MVGKWQELGGDGKFKIVVNSGWVRWFALKITSKVLEVFHLPFPSYEHHLILVGMAESCGGCCWRPIGSETPLKGEADSQGSGEQSLLQWSSPMRWIAPDGT